MSSSLINRQFIEANRLRAKMRRANLVQSRRLGGGADQIWIVRSSTRQEPV